ncbi:MAG: RsmD family RNA methyltransferase [Pseudomonadota bacterium]|nr:RsmD family RNA methyltransferase [Pseudomonadota bacterium]
MSVKIISGLYRDRNLETPEYKGDESPVRPTKSRVREAGFNMLFARTDFADKLCLDLYCGSGAAGIEILSRGAEKVHFVDTDITWARKNAEHCKIPAEQWLSHRCDVLNFTTSDTVDIVFADPPYGQGLAEKTLERKEQYGQTGTLWLLEVESRLDIDPEGFGFDLLKTKKYGKSTLYLLEQK